MIPKLIKLGVRSILEIICEKIIIKNIKVVINNEKYNGKIDELYIKAEDIIFNKINISYIDINLRDLICKISFNKNFLINNCYAQIYIKLTADNINNTLFNNKWNRLKTSIESFILMSFKSIDINNKSINFIPLHEKSNKTNFYTLQYDKNVISLVNNINKKKLTILNDKNIIVNNLFLNESYIELNLSSKIIFN